MKPFEFYASPAMFPTITREQYDAFVRLSAAADEAQTAFEAADAAVLDGLKRGLSFADRAPLKAARDVAGAAYESACSYRDASPMGDE